MTFCPDHPSIEPEAGYGLAGGGMGPYMYCPKCGRVLSKVQDPEMEDKPMTTPTPSLDATEARSADAKHPRITLDYMKSQIKTTYYIDGATIAGHANHIDWHDKSAAPNLHVLTVAMIVLKNGFVILGKSAPLSPANFDANKGRTFAYEDALRQAWPLYAFHELQADIDP